MLRMEASEAMLRRLSSPGFHQKWREGRRKDFGRPPKGVVERAGRELSWGVRREEGTAE